MRSAPRKYSTDEDLYTVALRALVRRSYSTFEMRSYLERRCEDASLARHAVARLKQARLIDDARYALEFARHHATIRHQGRYRIERELRLRGVSDKDIALALDTTFAETDATAVVAKLIERRVRLSLAPLDAKKTAALYRMLLRAGFDAQLIRQEIRKAARGGAASQPGDWPDAEFVEESL